MPIRASLVTVVRLFGIHISGTHRVEHPFAIGRDLRIADIAYGCKILESHWALHPPLRRSIDSEGRRRRQQYSCSHACSLVGVRAYGDLLYRCYFGIGMSFHRA